MNKLMAKYLNAYHKAGGDETAKVKYILMYHAHSWDWNVSDSLIADLIDDQNITGGDIVEFLSNAYAIDGGNQEFSSAIRAMKVCLQKAKMHDAKDGSNHGSSFDDHDGESDFDETNFIPNATDFLKYQPLSH